MIYGTDLEDLQRARQLLENPGLAARLTNYLGTPIEKGFGMLPEKTARQITLISREALQKAAQAAIFTLKDQPQQQASNATHKLLVAASGGIGGFFGLAALAVELPLSTTLMLRSIADIARSEDEVLAEQHTQLACLEVFALGGRSQADDGVESGYFAVRAVMAQSVTQAGLHLAKHGLSAEGAPAMVRLISQIAQRFSIQVSEKVAAQAVPIIGAAGGALVNTLFMNHFQDMARGHFIIRRLERGYGKDVIERAYRQLGA